MPRKERIASVEDDDIWDYRSQQKPGTSATVKCKRNSSTESQVISDESIKSEKTSTVVKSQVDKVKRKGGKKSLIVKKEWTYKSTPDRKHNADRSGRCPVCQMPFSILSRVETPSWHVDQCLEVPYSSKNECQQGIDCDSEIVSHYKKFRHTKLARSERKNITNSHRKTLGNVEKAKVKLKFDSNENGEQLLESCDSDVCIIDIDSDVCIIDLDSSPESPTGDKQRSDVDVGEEMRQSLIDSEEDLSDNKIYTATKLHSDQLKEATINNRTNSVEHKSVSLQPNLVSDPINIVYKENNNLDEVDGNDYDIVELPDLQDADDDFTKVEPADLVNDCSNGSSVHDINNVFDESREIADMIADVLSDNSPGVNTSDDSTTGKCSNDRQSDKVIDDSDDDLFESITESCVQTNKLGNPLTKFVDNTVKTSAISKLRETPAKSRSGSESSTDWEILKSTLTPSTAFGKCKLGSNSNNSLLDSWKQKNKDTLSGNLCDKEKVKSKEPLEKKGFFAKKLLMSPMKNMQRDTTTSLKMNMTVLKKVHDTNSPKGMNVTVSSNRNNLTESNGKGSDGHLVIKQEPATDFLSSVRNSAQIVGKRTASTDAMKFSIDFKAKKPKLEACSLVKSNFVGTKSKRKTIKKETDGSKTALKSVASYFISKKSTIPLTIATDDESSDDCGRFCEGKQFCNTSSIKKSGTCMTENDGVNSQSKVNRSPQCLDSCVSLPVNRGDNLESITNSRMELTGNQSTEVHTSHAGSKNSEFVRCSQSTRSQCTPDFGIQNVCTVSQNTYSRLQGGFIPDEDDKVVDDTSTYDSLDDGASASSSQTSLNVNFTSSAASPDSEVRSILKIQKSATDILMESAKLLRQKKTTLNSNNSKQMGNSVNDVLMLQPGNRRSRSSVGNHSRRGRGWTSANSSTESDVSRTSNEAKRKCPFYKKIPGTPFTVDAFKFGNIPDCKAYILSHFHYDHYGGLAKRFQNPIYCSKITGNLVQKKIGVDPRFIHTIPLNTPTIIEQVEITFLEANHCPGAVLILFKLKTGKVYLHTGDFRACQEMEFYPQLQNLRVNCLYLDTTYCDPQYDFPPQVDVIKFTVKLALDTLASNPRTLIVCGSYTIGKERIFMAIAQALNCKVCMSRDKFVVLNCLEDTDWKQRISLKWEDSGIHVVPMNKLNVKGLQEHLSQHGKKYTSVLGIEPTGWTHSKKVLSLHHIKPKVKKDNVTIYGVPYSEHSSFLEMKRFYQFIKPHQVLPTVNNGNVHSRRKMEVIFEAWSEELKSNQRNVEEQRSVKDWVK